MKKRPQSPVSYQVMTPRGMTNAYALLVRPSRASIARLATSNAPSSSMLIEKRKANATKFFEWAHQHPGITQRKVEPFISHQCDGYGLQACTDIKQGEVILSIGTDVWGPYDTEKAKEHLIADHENDIYLRIKQLYEQLAPYNVELANEYVNIVSLAIVLQKKLLLDESVLPYVNFVLDSVAHRSIPPTLLMNDDWMRCLKGTICGGGIIMRRDLFNSIAQGVSEIGGSAAFFKQFASVVTTRCINGDGMPFALTPYLDLVNHSKFDNAKLRFDNSTASFELYSTSDILEGEEVLMKAKGRHDPCVLPRAVPMVDAMVALVLADHLLLHQAQCGLMNN